MASERDRGHVRSAIPALLALFFCAVLTGSFYFMLGCRDIGACLSEHQTAAPVIFVVLYIMTCVLLLPGSVLTASAAVLFGPGLGTVLVSLSATAGACLAFLIARRLGRERVQAKLDKQGRLSRLDDALAAYGWKAVLAARLIPIIPFRITNYLLGVTDISFAGFAIGTWLGTLPAAFAYVYGAAALKNAAEQARRGHFVATEVLFNFGFVFAVLIFAVVFRLLRRRRDELRSRLESGDRTEGRERLERDNRAEEQ